MATSHNISLTDSQQQIVRWLTARYNEERELNLTTTQYLQLNVGNLISPFAAAFQQYREERLLQQFNSSDESTKSGAESALSLPPI